VFAASDRPTVIHAGASGGGSGGDKLLFANVNTSEVYLFNEYIYLFIYLMFVFGNTTMTTVD
jgi:hypothetical protein